ncbi:MAG: aminodeoxychorismate/anthranilate synthase component II [Acidobacteria bacterium]|nr:aminodeoxychorismate/anthranilate synthase component II [Acidobacteriota bacterium]
MWTKTLLIDNMDSFTQNVRHLFQMAGADVTVFRSDSATLTDIEKFSPELLLISPGPGSPEKAVLSRAIIRKFYGNIPIFGICLGMQCIALELGGIVSKGDPCHGKTRAVHHEGNGVFSAISSPFTVGRYHSLRLSECPDELEVNAGTSDGIPMSIRHRTLPLAGVQFHPESFLTEQGLQIARNVLHGNL